MRGLSEVRAGRAPQTPLTLILFVIRHFPGTTGQSPFPRSRRIGLSRERVGVYLTNMCRVPRMCVTLMMMVAAAVRVHAALWMRVIVGQRAGGRARASAGVDGGPAATTFIGGRWTPDGGEEGRGRAQRRLRCTSNGRNYENLFLLLSRPIALERCEVR